MCLATFFVFTTLFLSTFQSCPDGTIQGLNADDCYYFVKNGSDSGSQFEQYCGFNDFANGSKILAYGQWTSVLSAFENNFILQQAQTYLQVKNFLDLSRSFNIITSSNIFTPKNCRPLLLSKFRKSALLCSSMNRPRLT